MAKANNSLICNNQNHLTTGINGKGIPALKS